ncbi:phospholipase C/P1 nuclease [Lactarius pseudohatsudake]|nr:phospholipase C/P1 nuclease [Lactarius pseudohatsudake]
MRALILLNVAAIAGLSSLPRALAWGAAGHEIVATIAQSHLDPQVLDTVCSILASDATSGVRGDAPCYLSTVASWADKIRNHARWSGPLHYVGAVGDHPPDNCLFPGTDGWDGKPLGNVLDAIQNVTVDPRPTLLRARRRPPAVPSPTSGLLKALKFLIHFVGDMHQPLHLTGRDRGANGVKVSFDGRNTNLHSVWDTSLIAKYLRTIPRNYTRPLPVPALESSFRGAIYDPYIRRIVWEGLGVGRGTGRWETEADSWLACPASSSDSGPQLTSDSGTVCPYAWGASIHQLNCDVVWSAGLELSAREDDDAHFPNRGHTHGHQCGSGSAEDEVRAWEEVAGRGRGKGDYPELDTPEYAGRIESEWVIEKLLAQGGIRLAGILNALFSSHLELRDE